MYSRLLLAGAVAGAVIVGLPTVILSSTPPTQAHGLGRSGFPYCKNGVIGRVGIAVHKDKAKKRARRKWAYDAKRRYGYRYSGWNYAESTAKHYHCKHKAGTWRCRAVAYPCDAQAH